MLPNEQLIKEVKTVLQAKLGHDIRDVILFGSRATGTARDDSDYDVLIVLNRPYDWRDRDQVFDLIYDVELKYDILMNMFLISTYELRHSSRGAQPLFQHAIQQGVYA